MNAFDILAAVVAAWAIFSGWRRGLVAQIFSIVALVAAIILAARFGYRAGEFLKVSEQLRTPVGFVTVFAVTFIVISLVSRLFQNMVKGLGMKGMDVLLGILLALAKATVVICIAYSSFDAVNRSYDLVEQSYLDTSKCYRPICSLSEHLVPYVDRTRDTITSSRIGKEDGQ